MNKELQNYESSCCTFNPGEFDYDYRKGKKKKQKTRHKRFISSTANWKQNAVNQNLLKPKFRTKKLLSNQIFYAIQAV